MAKTMTIDPLTGEDLGFIAESIRYSKIRFEEYQNYPSWEYKMKRIKEAEEVLKRFTAFCKRLKEEGAF